MQIQRRPFVLGLDFNFGTDSQGSERGTPERSGNFSANPIKRSHHWPNYILEYSELLSMVELRSDNLGCFVMLLGEGLLQFHWKTRSEKKINGQSSMKTI